MESAPGILIRKTRLTESSLIIHWLTDGHGLIKTVAKGIRGAKSSFRTGVDLFLTAELSWTVARSSDLNHLRELVVRERRPGMAGSYRKVLLGSYLCQLVDRVLEPDHEVEGMFDLLTRALDYVEKNQAGLEALQHFERETARLLGLSVGDREVVEVLRAAAGGFPASRAQCLQLFGPK